MTYVLMPDDGTPRTLLGQVRCVLNQMVGLVSMERFFYNSIDEGISVNDPFERACVQIGIELASTYSGSNSKTRAFEVTNKFKQLACPICHQFKSESRLVICQHLRTPHIVRYRAMQCNICNQVISSRNDVFNHYLVRHRVAPKLPPPYRSFDCPFCPYQVTSRQSFAKHLHKCQTLQETGRTQKNYCHQAQALEEHDTFNYFVKYAYPSSIDGLVLKDSPKARGEIPAIAKERKFIPRNCNLVVHRQQSNTANVEEKSVKLKEVACEALSRLSMQELSVLGATMELIEPLLRGTNAAESASQLKETLIRRIRMGQIANGPTDLPTHNPIVQSPLQSLLRHVNDLGNRKRKHSDNEAVDDADFAQGHLYSIDELKDVFQEASVYQELDSIVQILSGLDTRLNWYVDTKVSEVKYIAGRCMLCRDRPFNNDIVSHYRTVHNMHIRHFQNNRVCIICACRMPDIRTLLIHQQIVHQVVPMCSIERIIQFHLWKSGQSTSALSRHRAIDLSPANFDDKARYAFQGVASIEALRRLVESEPPHWPTSPATDSQPQVQQETHVTENSTTQHNQSDPLDAQTKATFHKQFFCKKCGLTGLDLDELCRHLDERHDVELCITQQCSICGEQVRRGPCMAAHNRNHLENVSVCVERIDLSAISDCKLLNEGSLVAHRNPSPIANDKVQIERPDTNRPIRSSSTAKSVGSIKVSTKLAPIDEIAMD